MPGTASLAAGRYYAHPRNQFWRLLEDALGEPLGDAGWEERYERLRERGVALWDAIDDCERTGSLDASIRRATFNDLEGLLGRLPSLQRVLFNGRTAARAAATIARAGLDGVVVPSSSPAHAGMPYEAKLRAWREALRPVLRARRHRPVEVPIVLSELDGVRYLHFGTPWVQGAMLVDEPDVLVLEYVQRMMAWLLFRAAPGDILQLGLGAGALTRFSRRRLRDTRVTVIEASRDVIDVCRGAFGLGPDDARLTVRCDDAAAFMRRAASARSHDVIQVDLYDAQARGPTCDSLPFYRDCRRALREPGICVVNLFGRHRSYRSNLARLRSAFDGRLLELPGGTAGNRVVIAFAGPPLSVPWSVLHERAQVLQARLGLPAPAWVRALETTGGGTVCRV
jgi:hypoxanthine-DNA glycosylase